MVESVETIVYKKTKVSAIDSVVYITLLNKTSILANGELDVDFPFLRATEAVQNLNIFAKTVNQNKTFVKQMFIVTEIK